MSTRRQLWQLLWEVGAARRLSRACIQGEHPYWQVMWNRWIWAKSNEREKRAICDYMNDLEMIAWVILKDLGLPEMVVERVMLFYGYEDCEEVEGDKQLLWDAFWVDTWDTDSDVAEQEWYQRELVRQTAGEWLFFVYCRVTHTEIPSRIRYQYRFHKEYYFLNTWEEEVDGVLVPALESQKWYREW